MAKRHREFYPPINTTRELSNEQLLGAYRGWVSSPHDYREIRIELLRRLSTIAATEGTENEAKPSVTISKEDAQRIEKWFKFVTYRTTDDWGVRDRLTAAIAAAERAEVSATTKLQEIVNLVQEWDDSMDVTGVYALEKIKKILCAETENE